MQPTPSEADSRPSLPMVLWPLSEVPRELRKEIRQERKKLRAEARKIYNLQIRKEVARRRLIHQSWSEIAADLGISAQRCRQAYNESLKQYEKRRPTLLQRKQRRRRVSDPTSRPSTALAPIYVRRGTVIDPPDTVRLKREVLNLRKRALPYEVIADLLGIDPEEAKELGKQAIRGLAGDEMADIELAKRLQLEQLDEMIAGIYPKATGGMFEAIDRVVKLLDAKAKILGLNAPTRIDIDSRLVIMAEQMDADIEELRDIAKDVLQAYPSLQGR